MLPLLLFRHMHLLQVRHLQLLLLLLLVIPLLLLLLVAVPKVVTDMEFSAPRNWHAAGYAAKAVLTACCCCQEDAAQCENDTQGEITDL
jgi:hypothetical protein